MCGRFTLTTPGELVAEAFGLDEVPALASRYNIAPAQPVAVVRQAPGAARQLALVPWGLPGLGADEAGGHDADALLINARSETVATKPTFRDAFRSRRCLIPADGFYEWRKAGARREPFHVRRRDQRPFAFAGLWQPVPHGQETAEACVILTTDANALVAGIHDRMPVILRPEDFAAWLDPATRDAAALRRLLVPSPADELLALPVGPFVNSARSEGPRCLELARQRSLFET